MELHSIERVKAYIAALRKLKELDDVTVERLNGGVSCLVWKVLAGGERWVLKQALGKLDVREEWFSDVRRIEREQLAMHFLEPLLPVGSMPHIVHADRANHLYVMTCAEEEAVPWKNKLMEGQFHAAAALNAGHLLRAMHENSRKRASMEQQEMFMDLSFFNELRIEPFHRHLLSKFPKLSSDMNVLIHDLTERRDCLVHGDFSPKNMLVDEENRVMLLDYEVAHWGNPVFDLAFMLTHLLLKGWVLNRQVDAWTLMNAFLQAYGYKGEENRLLGHTGAILLARVDGKSPAGYLKDEDLKDRIRKKAIAWIRHSEDELWPHLEAVRKGWQ